jgi:arylsulfatase A-like enzyme
MAANAQATAKPNVLILVSDDQRFDTIHALGNDRIHTPNLDRLVKEGTTFTRAYCMGAMQGAVCVPSRAMFLSGRSLFRVPANLADTPTLPEIFGKAGYSTFGTGKWHNGPASYARSFQNGDTIFFGGMSDQFKVSVQPFDPNGKYPKLNAKIGDKHASTLFVDSAERFIKKYKGEKPFFCYVAFTSPHDPRTAPEEFRKKYDPAEMVLPKNYLPVHPFNNGEMKVRDEELAPWPRTEAKVKKHLADYYAMIEHLDFEIGRLLKVLDDTMQRDKTLIVFHSDHGLAIGSHGLFGKQNLYDHSMRAPLIFSGPGIAKDKRTDAMCYLFDVPTTVCAAADVKTAKAMEGQNLMHVIRGDAENCRTEIFGAYRDVQRSVRTACWKLIRYPQINKTQLFDMQSDPNEMKDLAGNKEHAERVKDMMMRLERQQKDFDDKQPLSTDKPMPLEVEGIHFPAGKPKTVP